MPVAKPGNIPPLDPKTAAPFYRQIYDRFRGAIASGLLKPGDRIPSARALTRELGLARGTRRCGLFFAGGGGLHSSARPGRDHRDAGPQTANACRRVRCLSQIPASLRRSFRPDLDFAVPDGLARPGCVSSKDLGTPERAMCARHAAIRHGSSLCVRLAGAARPDRCVPPGFARDQLLSIPDICNVGISPLHRVDCACAC